MKIKSAGNKATLRFWGTGVTWIGTRAPENGTANVYVDGTFKEQVSLYSATEQEPAPVYSLAGLAKGSHTITIEVPQGKADRAHGYVCIDAFDVLP